MTKAIYFDMDGTFVNLYGIETWLDDIIARDVRPYRDATPLLNLSSFARILNNLQKKGYTIGVISWLAKCDDEDYHKRVEKAKRDWLKKHLSSVCFDEIHIVNYGTPKSTCGNGILFDDEEPNRKEWKGKAYDVNDIIGILKTL